MVPIKRNQASLANKLLEHFPAISLIGSRQTGKTTLAKYLRPDWRYLDLENPQDRELLQHDPVLYFRQFPQDLIIDEAQLYPELFNVLRGVIDQQRDLKGRFIITGSSSSELLTSISESLAGRVATLEIGTLKANEFYQIPQSPFYQLFSNKITKETLVQGSPPLNNQKMQHVWLKGGYPEPLLNDSEFYYQQWMSNYYNNYINRDVSQLFPRLNKNRYQQFIKMLSKLSSTILNKSNIARALEVSEATAREYLKIAEGTFLWRELTSYETNIIKSILKMPKGHMRDSGLLHYLTNIRTLDDLYTNPLVGQSFEAFVVEELIKGLHATEATHWQYQYFRTRKGAEVDLILSGHFGVLPIEIKYGTQVDQRQLSNLKSFVEKHQCPFGLVINQSDTAMWLSDTIYQIPVGWI